MSTKVKYVVYIKNDDNYENTLKETKKQMKDFLEEGEKVIYIRGEYTNIAVLSEYN